MKIPVLDKFLWCVELRPACLGIGYGFLVLEVLGLITFLVQLIGGQLTAGVAISSIIFALISIVFFLMLVYGVTRDRASYVYMALWFFIIHVVLAVLSSFAQGLGGILFIILVYMPFAIYCILTIRSYYLVMIGQHSAGAPPGA